MTHNRWLSLLGAAAMAGCASPSYRHGAADASASVSAPLAADAAATEAGFPSGDWWLVYGDPQLNALVAEALAATPNLELAIARVRIAEAGEGLNLYLGVWGRDRIVLAATTSDADVRRQEMEQASGLVASGVVAAYGQVWGRMTDLSAFDDAARHVRRTGSSAKAGPGARGGMGPRPVRAGGSRTRATLEAELDAARRRLAGLVGRPYQALTLHSPTAVTGEIHLVPGQVERLLARRPDLLAARWWAELGAAEPGSAASAKALGAGPGAPSRAIGLNNLVRSGSDLGQAGLASRAGPPDGRTVAERDYERAMARAVRDVGEATAAERRLDAAILQARRALIAAEAELDGDPRAQGRGGGATGGATGAGRPVNGAVLALRERLAGLQAQRLIADALLARTLTGAVVWPAVTPKGD